jgi:hypothetical protein
MHDMTQTHISFAFSAYPDSAQFPQANCLACTWEDLASTRPSSKGMAVNSDRGQVTEVTPLPASLEVSGESVFGLSLLQTTHFVREESGRQSATDRDDLFISSAQPGDSGNIDISPVLQQAIAQLRTFIASENWQESMELAFGDEWLAEDAAALLNDLLQQETVPTITTLPFWELGAFGAYMLVCWCLTLPKEPAVVASLGNLT